MAAMSCPAFGSKYPKSSPSEFDPILLNDMRARKCHPSACLQVFAVLLLCTPAFSQDDGVELFHKMQRALGGADKLAAINDFEETVKANVWNESGKPMGFVRKRTRWIKPNVLRLDQVGPRDTYVLYFDGTAGWEILPDRQSVGKTTGVAIDLVGDELEFARGYLANFWLKQWLADRMPGYTVSSPAQNVVRVSVNDKSTDIVLDASSGLPDGKEIRAWKKIDGIRFPSRRWNYHNGIRLADIRTINIKLNRGLKPEVLSRKPYDFKPVMTGN
jgi:hypothetical protein